jgi:Protein of unknown function (DUF3987)
MLIPETALKGKRPTAPKRSYIQTVLDAELSKIECAPKSASNVALNGAAFALGQFVGANAISRTDAEAQLLEAAKSRGINITNARPTIKSGLDAGINQPRNLANVRNGTAALNAAPDPKITEAPDADADAKAKSKRAGDILRASIKIAGTLAETYLETRAISATSEQLKFHPACRSRAGKSGEPQMPALIARIQNVMTGKGQGIVRILLDANGNKATMADGGTAKRNLGIAKNGAVIFGDIRDPEVNTVIECEGVETAISLWQATSHVTLAELSGGSLGKCELPAHITTTIIHAEHGTEKFALEAAARRHAEGKQVLIATSPDASLKDANDLLRDEHHGEQSVREMVENATPHTPPTEGEAQAQPEADAEASHDIDDPIPLMRESDIEAAEFPTSALGAFIEIAEAIGATTQAPAAIIGNSILAVVSLAAQAHVDVKGLSHSTFPVSQYFISVGESGERKSSIDNAALKGVRTRQRELLKDCADAAPRAIARLAVWEAEFAAAKSKKGASVVEKENDILALGLKPKQPRTGTLLTQNTTTEKLHNMFVVGQPSMGLFAGEGGSVLGGHSLNADNKTAAASFYNEMWDGAEISRDRVSEGSSRIAGRRLAMHLLCQPMIAQKFFGDKDLVSQGFTARFLTAWPRSTIGTRLFRDPTPDDIATVDAFADEVSRRLRFAHRMREDAPDELWQRTLHLSPEARALVIKFHDDCEVRAADGGDFAPIRGFAAKAPENACRIAGSLTWWQNDAATTISDHVMANAIALVQFYASEALRLYTDGTAPGELVAAQTLLNWLHAKGSQATTVRQIVTYGPSILRNSSAARAAIETLTQHRWLKRAPSGTVVDGRKARDAWFVTPKQEA